MRTMRINFLLGLGLGLSALVGLSPRPVAAQAADSRWLPWLGCWQAEDAPSDAGLLCVRPLDGQSSVEILRVTGTDVVSREVVWADGQQHETTREGCNGWEKGTFSSDGARVFLSSSHTCEGGAERTGGGIMALVSPTEWLDVRYLGMGEDRTPWVQRYRAATDQQAEAAGMGGILADRAWAVRTARMAAAAAPSVDDVIEASQEEPAEVVQAWVAERKAPLKLDAKELERMADAGVAPDVIDVAVAVSYPSHFTVRAEPRGEESADRSFRGSYYPGWGFDPFYYRYGYDPLYYGAYGYGYGWGGYPVGYYGGYGYTPVIVISNNDQNPLSQQHGRFVPGRGYTRGGSSGSSGASGSAARAPARSGSTGATSGSSSSSGRTAHRRGGGGGGSTPMASRAPAPSGSTGATSTSSSDRTAHRRSGGGGGL
ncbi:MAG: hypothetical protein LJF04_08930 [Gemmatimonadetes bacterium]|nr:hypothetical protein [Gemmatimonadota bacterium]